MYVKRRYFITYKSSAEKTLADANIYFLGFNDLRI